jgi:hypothetical protein
MKRKMKGTSKRYQLAVIISREFLFHCKIALLKTDISPYTRPRKANGVKLVATTHFPSSALNENDVSGSETMGGVPHGSNLAILKRVEIEMKFLVISDVGYSFLLLSLSPFLLPSLPSFLLSFLLWESDWGPRTCQPSVLPLNNIPSQRWDAFYYDEFWEKKFTPGFSILAVWIKDSLDTLEGALGMSPPMGLYTHSQAHPQASFSCVPECALTLSARPSKE